MNEYDYSLDTYFGGFIPNNINALIKSVKNSSIITKTLQSTQTSNGNFSFTFDNSLTLSEETELTNIVVNHDNTIYPTKILLQKNLNSNESHTVNHFYDFDKRRKIQVTALEIETRNEKPYIFKDDESLNYVIDNSLASLYATGFRFEESGFSNGSNLSPSGTAFASSEQTDASNANDGSSNTFWYNNTSVSAAGSWWAVDFGSIVGIRSAQFVQYSTGLYATDVSVEWSDDGETWTEIARTQGITYGNGTYTFPTFSEPVYARYFRFYAYDTNSPIYFIIREGRFFEAVGTGFPTNSPSVITNNVSNKQFSTVEWDTINSCKLNGIFPSNTSTKILLSFDSGSTWVYWNGSSWATSTLSNIGTQSMTNTVFDSLTSTEYGSQNGLNSSTNTLDIAIQIETSNSSVTPIIKDIDFNITTKEFEEIAVDSMIQVRFLDFNKSVFKNMTDSNKTFNISINI